jgi:hypothetical protein
MKWTDINDIAIELSEAHPNKDPLKSTLSICAIPSWRCRVLMMCPSVVVKRFLKPSSKPGLTKSNENP